jgi:hypothetical protein
MQVQYVGLPVSALQVPASQYSPSPQSVSSVQLTSQQAVVTLQT